MELKQINVNSTVNCQFVYMRNTYTIFTFLIRKVIILRFTIHETSAMTASTIAEIYDAIKHCNGEYCSICFSPASIRKLVTPTYTIQLRFAVKYSEMDVSISVRRKY